MCIIACHILAKHLTRFDAERRNLPTVLRIAPHYYNSENEIERIVRQLVSFL